MSMPYTHKHSGVSVVPPDFSESSGLNFRPYLYNTGVGQTRDDYISGNLREYKQQTTYVTGKLKSANSPISPLSPPQSSAGSDTCPQSHLSLDYHYDSDSHRSDNSCCSHYKDPYFYSQSPAYEGIGCQGVQKNTVSFESSPYTSSPDSLQPYTHDPRVFQGAEASVPHFSTGDSMQHILQELETALMGPDGDDTDFTDFLGEGQSASPAGDWTDTLDELLGKNSQQNPIDVKEEESARSEHFSYSDNLQHVKAGVPNIENLCISDREREQQVALEHFKYFPNTFSAQPSAGLLQNGSRGSQVKELLVMCAAAIAERRFELADEIMTKLKQSVSICGDPIERLAAYMSEGLVARLASSGQSIYKALKCKEAPAADVLSAMQKLYEICPYFKFGYMAANGAIAEAFKDEAKVHIFDFQIAQGTQWISLIQALANRPGGPPCVRITSVDDPESGSGPIGGMQVVRQRLGNLAEVLRVPFEFHSVPVRMAEVEAYMIEQRPGEALAVNFALQLHHMPDESVCLTNPRDRLLRMAKGMNPKVLTLVEMEANTNTAPFLHRFMETLDYYSAIFDSIDVVLPRESKDRVNVEQQCLARDIVNVIACEGPERVERHEPMGKWKARMMMAGFRPHPLSSYVNCTIKALLEHYCENYRLKEEGEALFLGWLNRALVVASAWH